MSYAPSLFDPAMVADLSQPVVLANSASSIVTDTTDAPWISICYITDVFNGREYQASGVLIAPDEVLTASHVLWSTQYGAATQVEVSPGANESGPTIGTVGALNLHYNQVNDSNGEITEGDSQRDYALIHLDTPLGPLGTFGVTANYAGGQVNVTGYPGYLDGALDNAAENVALDPYVTLLEGPSIGPGSSGGPVWTNGADGPQVVGVVSSAQGTVGTEGYFAQITDAALSQINGWVRQDNGVPLQAATNDFNGDHVSDVLFQNSNSGLLLDWRMSNGGFAQSEPIAGTTPDWVYQATGDFNGDGTSDILFRNADSGLLLDWQMSGGSYVQATPIAGTTPDWQVMGTGDFNGDGTTDILFENTNSHLFLDWQMENGGYGQAIPIAEASPGWQFLGTGDFNGDGTTDILFQNSASGLVLDWQMSGGGYGQAIPIGAASAGWQFLGTGDFNGDYTTDILFQNQSSGLLVDWQMSGGRFVQSIPIASAGPDWKFVGTGDFNGDGTTDILFRNTNSGLVLDWQMANGHFYQSIPVAGTTPDWKTLG
jgi:V8-like Glu-specific endopeptidase